MDLEAKASVPAFDINLRRHDSMQVRDMEQQQMLVAADTLFALNKLPYTQQSRWGVP